MTNKNKANNKQDVKNKKDIENKTNSKQKEPENNKKISDVQIKNTKPKKEKKDYEAMFKESQLDVERLNIKVKELVFENNKNIDAFQSKAQGFQSKAQEEVNKVKEELRAKAELDALETKKYGAQNLLENILEPINNIDIAIAAGEKQTDPGVQAYVQGFKMLMGQLFSELESYGIAVINPKVGDEYNPEIHQAFSMVDGDKSNTISQIKKKGYKLHERVIKPAVVVVIK